MATAAEKRDAFVSILEEYSKAEWSHTQERIASLLRERVGKSIMLYPIPIFLHDLQDGDQVAWERFEFYLYPGPAEEYDALNPEAVINSSDRGTLIFSTFDDETPEHQKRRAHLRIKDPKHVRALYTILGLDEFFILPEEE